MAISLKSFGGVVCFIAFSFVLPFRSLTNMKHMTLHIVNFHFTRKLLFCYLLLSAQKILDRSLSPLKLDKVQL